MTACTKRRTFTLAAMIVLSCAAAGQGSAQQNTAQIDAFKAALSNLEAQVNASYVFAPSVVTGAPYTTTVITESAQKLYDGNVITHRSSQTLYRDSQGRTRREEDTALNADGSRPAANLVFIVDPVAGLQYTLQPANKSARTIKLAQPGGGRGRRGPSGAAGGTEPALVVPAIPNGSAVVVKEDLGTQTIEGVAATGTRETRTIPAGQIGNELPIAVVTENWYSPDLKTNILIKHSDPRTGTTVTRWTKIDRSEPAADLFTVPQDYTVKNLGQQ